MGVSHHAPGAGSCRKCPVRLKAQPLRYPFQARERAYRRQAPAHVGRALARQLFGFSRQNGAPASGFCGILSGASHAAVRGSVSVCLSVRCGWTTCTCTCTCTCQDAMLDRVSCFLKLSKLEAQLCGARVSTCSSHYEAPRETCASSTRPTRLRSTAPRDAPPPHPPAPPYPRRCGAPARRSYLAAATHAAQRGARSAGLPTAHASDRAALCGVHRSGRSGPRCHIKPRHASAYPARSSSRPCPRTCLRTSRTRCADSVAQQEAMQRF